MLSRHEKTPALAQRWWKGEGETVEELLAAAAEIALNNPMCDELSCTFASSIPLSWILFCPQGSAIYPQLL